MFFIVRIPNWCVCTTRTLYVMNRDRHGDTCIIEPTGIIIILCLGFGETVPPIFEIPYINVRPTLRERGNFLMFLTERMKNIDVWCFST